MLSQVGSKDIRRLAFSSQIQRLTERGASFDLMRNLGVTSREPVYSNVIAFLLDPDAQHCFAERPLVRFLRAVEEASEDGVLPFDSLLGSELGQVRVSREQKGIDILIELIDQRAVVAIENKVFAGEQAEQVARYQAQLEHDYPPDVWCRCLVFLTPYGVAPNTRSRERMVPVISLDYRFIADLLDTASTSNPETESARFAGGLAEHIRHEILGDHPMQKDIWALWSDPAHARAMAEAVRHAPDLMSVKDDYLEHVRRWAENTCGLTLTDVSLYPTKGIPKELAFTFMQWKNAGLPVLIKFYWYSNTAFWEDPGYQPTIRALIWWEDFSNKKDNFETLRSRYPQRVSQTFEPIKNWGRHWHRFLYESDYPEDAIVPFTNDRFVEKLVDRTQKVIQDVDAAIRGHQATGCD